MNNFRSLLEGLKKSGKLASPQSEHLKMEPTAHDFFASRKTVKAVSAAPSDQQNDVSLNIPADTDAASRHVFMGDKPVLRNWKIMASSEEAEFSRASIR